MENRMKDAGYKVQEKMMSIGQTAKLLKLSAPYGNEDYAYWIAFGVNGKQIKIIEAVGELGSLTSRHSENILNQIKVEFKESP